METFFTLAMCLAWFGIVGTFLGVTYAVLSKFGFFPND